MYPVDMTMDTLTEENIPKGWNYSAQDYSCIICPMGGDWDFQSVLDHYEEYMTLK